MKSNTPGSAAAATTPAAPKPRLLVLASTYPRWASDPEPGFVHALCRRLTTVFEVHALSPHAPGALTEECLDGVFVHRYRYAPARLEVLVQGGGILNNLRHRRWKWLLVLPFLAGMVLHTWRLGRQLRPAGIHAHWIVPQGLALTVARLFQRSPPPFLLTVHGGDLFGLRGPMFAALKRFVIRRAGWMTVVSRAMLSEAARLGADASRTRVLPMGVDFDSLFVPGAPAARVDGEMLFVGRLVEKKGLRYLIEALPGIAARVPTAHLVIAGAGPEEPALRAQVERLGIADRVRFVGALAQADLPALYQRASVFVAPFVQAESGDQEGLGLVVVEALACGCPVVTGNLAVLDDILTSAEADWRVDPKQTEQLTNRVVAVLGDGKAAFERALSIRQRLVARLGWDAVAGEYARLLLEMKGPDEGHPTA